MVAILPRPQWINVIVYEAWSNVVMANFEFPVMDQAKMILYRR